VTTREAETAGSEAEDSKQNKKNSNDGYRVHFLGEPFLLLGLDRVTSGYFYKEDALQMALRCRFRDGLDRGRR
jgi:hypothetical protein